VRVLLCKVRAEILKERCRWFCMKYETQPQIRSLEAVAGDLSAFGMRDLGSSSGFDGKVEQCSFLVCVGVRKERRPQSINPAEVST